MINATLIIQIIHFCIAYVILDHLFLRKAVQVIQQEDNELLSLQRTIHDVTDELAIRTMQKNQEWHLLQKKLQQERPDLLGLVRKPIKFVEGREIKSSSVGDIARFAQHMKELIVARIAHD